MNRFLKALVSRYPALIVSATVAAGMITGFPWLVAGGVLGAVMLAFHSAFSPKRGLLEDAARAAGYSVSDMSVRLKELRKALRRAARVPGAEQTGLQALEQFSKVQERYLALRAVLRQRFNEHELTYDRYLKSAGQVYLSVIDGLRETATALDTIASVDVDYTRAHLRRLAKKGGLSESEQTEMESLEHRLQTHEAELRRVKGILASHEQAITQLLVAATALAQAKTNAGLASADVPTAMRELEDLAARASKYSVAHHP